MKCTQINSQVLAAATGMLQPFFPELNPQKLLAALNSCGNETRAAAPVPEKPMTRNQAASLLGVSLNTLNRYMNTGVLRRVKIGPRVVRINPEDVRALLNPEEEEEEVRNEQA